MKANKVKDVMMKFFDGKPSAILLALTAAFSVVVIAITIVAALIASKVGVNKTENAVTPSQAINNGVSGELSQAVGADKFPFDTENSTIPQTTQSEKELHIQPQKLGVNEFSELNIKGFELQKIKFLVTHADMWHDGKIKGNGWLTFGLSEFIERFAKDYGFDKNENWKSAPMVFNEYVSGADCEIKGAISIDDLNRVLCGIYGDSAEKLSYSDFPEVLELSPTWKIWHTTGGKKGSAQCSECLLIVGNKGYTDFEESLKDECGRFAGFKADGDMISAICVSLYEADEFMAEPHYMLELESRLAKGSNGYYIHSVSESVYSGSNNPLCPIAEYEDYEFYNVFEHWDEPCNPVDSLPSALNAEEIDSPEDAFEDYLDMRKFNEYADDFADTEDEQYCFVDINRDGVNEMVITGKITYDNGWYFTRIYTCNPDDYSVSPASELIYHYGEPKISKEYSALVVSPYRGSSVFLEPCILSV